MNTRSLGTALSFCLGERTEIQTERLGSPRPTSTSTKTVTYSYYGRFAIGVCEGPIAQFGRIWADGKLMRDAGGSGKYEGNMTFYTGTEEQAPDPTIQSYEGTSKTPAFKGLAYIVFHDIPLADWGNRIPNLKIEVITKAGATATFDSAFQGKSTYLRDAGHYGVFRSKSFSADAFGNYLLVGELGGAAASSPSWCIPPVRPFIRRLSASFFGGIVASAAGSAFRTSDWGALPSGRPVRPSALEFPQSPPPTGCAA